MAEITPLLVAVMAFGCVTIIIFVAGRYAASRARMQRRLPVLVPTSQGAGGSEHVVPNFFLASLLIGRLMLAGTCHCLTSGNNKLRAQKIH